jgi:hypothetical protein
MLHHPNCKNAGTVVNLFGVLRRRALPKFESVANAAPCWIFSSHLFSPANGEKGFHTCRLPQSLVIIDRFYN